MNEKVRGLPRHLLIGEVGAKAGLDPKTIRYYEEVALLPKPRRRPTGYAGPGYRLYSEQDVQRLQLIKGARLLGLSLAEIREFLASVDGGRARRRLPQLLEEIMGKLEAKIEDLEQVRDRLRRVRQAMAKERGKPQGGCCDPLCAPEICPPPLVKIEKRRTNDERR